MKLVSSHAGSSPERRGEPVSRPMSRRRADRPGHRAAWHQAQSQTRLCRARRSRWAKSPTNCHRASLPENNNEGRHLKASRLRRHRTSQRRSPDTRHGTPQRRPALWVFYRSRILRSPVFPPGLRAARRALRPTSCLLQMARRCSVLPSCHHRSLVSMAREDAQSSTYECECGLLVA